MVYVLFFVKTRRPWSDWRDTLYQGWRTFLRMCTQIVYKFRSNSFTCPWEFWRAK